MFDNPKKNTGSEGTIISEEDQLICHHQHHPNVAIGAYQINLLEKLTTIYIYFHE
jgi:hypothetical protein